MIRVMNAYYRDSFLTCTIFCLSLSRGLEMKCIWSYFCLAISSMLQPHAATMENPLSIMLDNGPYGLSDKVSEIRYIS